MRVICTLKTEKKILFVHVKGFHPGYAPQNPVYPPDFGSGVPPAQPPQWNAPPTQYNPSAPMVRPKYFSIYIYFLFVFILYVYISVCLFIIER